MTNDQFAELKSLILQNSAEIKRNQGMIRVNYEMIVRVYTEHTARFDRIDNLLTGIEDALTRVELRSDSVVSSSTGSRAEQTRTPGQVTNRLKALEN